MPYIVIVLLISTVVSASLLFAILMQLNELGVATSSGGASKFAIVTSLTVVIFITVFFITRNIFSKIQNNNSYGNTAFLSCILMVPVVMIIATNYTGEISVMENKKLAGFPGVFVTNERFPRQMDNYINDRMGFKFQLIGLMKDFPWLEGSSIDISGRVVIGKNDWLFFHDTTEDTENLFDFQRIARFSEEDLKVLRYEFERVNTVLEKQGIKLIVAIAPNKHNIYPEYYSPAYNRLENVPSRYEQLAQLMNKSTVEFITFKDVLMDAKKTYEHDLYFKQDTHWNAFGGYVAYKEIIKSIRKYYPDIKEIDPATIAYINLGYETGDLIGKLLGGNINNQDIVWRQTFKDNITVTSESKSIKEHPNRLFRTANSNVVGPKIMMVRDSFTIDIMPYLERSTSEITDVVCWATSPLTFLDVISKEKPDILIWEMHERYIWRIVTGAFKQSEQPH